MTRHTSQRGFISPVAVIVLGVLAVLAMGVITIGRLTAHRAAAQRAADSAALAAAQLARDRGLPFTTADKAQQLAGRNSRLPVVFDWTVTESDTQVNFTVRTHIGVSLPKLSFGDDRTTVHAVARGTAQQQTFEDVEVRVPRLMLVLDYSGSMLQPFEGGGGRAIDVLEQTVAELVNSVDNIEFGGVFYSTNVFRWVGLDAAAPANIVDIMNRFDAGGETATADALQAARQRFIRAPGDTGHYVLLVSDGAPCCTTNSIERAVNAARQLWADDVTIISLEIRRADSTAAHAQFMAQIAGSLTSPGNGNLYLVATTAAAFVAAFRRLVATILCLAGPLDPVPRDLSTIHLFLRRGDTERPLQRLASIEDLSTDDNKVREAFAWKPDDNRVALTEAACDRVTEDGERIVVRYDQPRLTN